MLSLAEAPPAASLSKSRRFALGDYGNHRPYERRSVCAPGWLVADAVIDNAIAENGGGASQQTLARQARTHKRLPSRSDSHTHPRPMAGPR